MLGRASVLGRTEPAEPARAWRALSVITLTIFLAGGARFSFSAFVVPIQQDLQLDRAVLSAAGFLTLLGYAISQPVSGVLSARYGARPVMLVSALAMAVGAVGASQATGAWQLYLFAGLLPGLSFGGASIVPGAAFLAKVFTRRLGLATGIMSSAIPASTAVFVPLAALLIPLIGWRATYLYAGLLVALIGFPALLLIREPPAIPRSESAPQPEVNSPLASRFPRDVLLLGVGFFGCGFTDQFVSFHLVALTQDAGYAAGVGASALALLTAVGIIGSVASGPVADRVAARLMLAGLYLLRALCLPLLLLVGTSLTSGALVLFAVLFGFTFIANQAAGTRLVRQRYGPQAVGTLMGNVGFAHQIGGAIGIGLGGLSVTYFGGYGLALVVAAGVALVAGLCQLLIPAAKSDPLRAAA